jgi:ankyrin repeat protein
VALLTDRGEDPLMLVANRNDEKMERWLVSLGVPIDTKNSADQTTFQIALQRKNHSLCTLMIVTRLLFLIANQQIPNPSIDALNFLFAFGGQTNQRDHQLRTLLHVAASCKNADFCEYLLHNQGADMDSRDIHGNTPSEAADAHGSYGNYQYDFSDIENNISEFFDLCASGNQLLEVTKLLEIYNPQLFLDWQKQAKENASTRGEKRPFPAPSEQNNPPDSSSSFFENQNNLKRQRLNTNVAVSATRSNSQQPN